MEQRITQRWAGLEEGRTGRGLVVVPATALEGPKNELQTLLAALPASFAPSIVLWGDHPAARSLSARNPSLTVYGGENLSDPKYLKDFGEELRRLLWMQRAGRVGYLNDNDAPNPVGWRLPIVLMGMTVDVIQPGDLTRLFDVLGVDPAVAQQVGLEELMSDLATLQAA